MTSTSGVLSVCVVTGWLLIGGAGWASADLRAAPSQLPASGGSRNVSEEDVDDALLAIAQANSYKELLAVLTDFEDVVTTDAAVRVMEARLKTPGLTDDDRGSVNLMRQLFVDCRDQGTETAGGLVALRLIAGAALIADETQLAGVLQQFSDLAPKATAALVGAALGTQGNSWPAAMRTAMDQLASDWRTSGARVAAANMVAAVQKMKGAASAGNASPTSDPTLVGHWRATEIVFEQPRDTNLLISADGSAEREVATAGGHEPAIAGRWSVQGRTLRIEWENGNVQSDLFTFYQGQLVWPNVNGRRRFWDRLN